jgi:hypothetical protein
MSDFIGKQIELGLAVEGVRGTAEPVASKWVKNVSADILPRSEKVVDDNSQGVLEDSSNSRVVRKFVDGDLSGIAHVDTLGYLLYQIYGSVDSDQVAGIVYDHDFTLLQDIAHPTLSGIAKDGSVAQKVFNEGVVNTLELTASTDDFVRFTSNMIFSEGVANSDTPTYDKEFDFIGRDITIKVADTEGGLAGATPLKVKELDITWDTGAISDYHLGSFHPNNYNANMAIEGSITKNYVDDLFNDLNQSDDAKYMEIKIEGDTSIASTHKPTITILLNKVQVQDWDRSGGNDELVEETIEFKAFYNETDGQQSKVSVRNTTEAYQIGS